MENKADTAKPFFARLYGKHVTMLDALVKKEQTSAPKRKNGKKKVISSSEVIRTAIENLYENKICKVSKKTS